MVKGIFKFIVLLC